MMAHDIDYSAIIDIDTPGFELGIYSARCSEAFGTMAADRPPSGYRV
jgi:hypothetical protein